ncbi:cotton fiber protein [Wolffia australiana]
MSGDRGEPKTRLKRMVERAILLLSGARPAVVAQWLYGGEQRRPLGPSETHGLADAVFIAQEDEFHDAVSPACSSRSASPSPRILGRTMSAVWADISMNRSSFRHGLVRFDSNQSESSDVNERSENFIANFRKHLDKEREISLELRYCKSSSLESKSSSPSRSPSLRF